MGARVLTYGGLRPFAFLQEPGALQVKENVLATNHHGRRVANSSRKCVLSQAATHCQRLPLYRAGVLFGDSGLSLYVRGSLQCLGRKAKARRRRRGRRDHWIPSVLHLVGRPAEAYGIGLTDRYVYRPGTLFAGGSGPLCFGPSNAGNNAGCEKSRRPGGKLGVGKKGKGVARTPVFGSYPFLGGDKPALPSRV